MIDELNLEVLDPSVNQAYLPQLIPSTRDREISSLLSGVIEGRLVARFARMLQTGHAEVLRAFAERMASAAVRKGDTAILRIGFVALLVSWPVSDSREALTIFPLFYDAMRRLDVDVSSFLESIRESLGEQLVSPFVGFLRRSTPNKSLESMGYAEGTDRDGFRYVRNW